MRYRINYGDNGILYGSPHLPIQPPSTVRIVPLT
jgi:hypothetical protein